jgi:hypothetical protein
VRKEKFGLLFYNSKGPKLTFVRSGQWIHPSFFSEELGLKKWLQTRFPVLIEEEMLRIEEKLFRALQKLVQKELIVEKTVDS